MSCPGRSQISQTSSPVALSVLSESENFWARVGNGCMGNGCIDVDEVNVEAEDTEDLISSGGLVLETFF